MAITLPHPFDLEIQDFQAYDLILDLRSQYEWLQDHVPGAVCRPALTMSDEAMLENLWLDGAPNAEQRRSDLIETRTLEQLPSIRSLVATGHVLVYCSRGGSRSLVTARVLERQGYRVDILRGGWSAYRRWVPHALDAYIAATEFLPPSAASSLDTEEDPLQVLDLPAMLRSPELMLYAMPGGRIPNAMFESHLLQTLRHLDRSRPVILRLSKHSDAQVDLPAGMLKLLRQNPAFTDA